MNKIPLSEFKEIVKGIVRETLNERKEKWIQKAVDPEHKGYCTPMTKSTCTPARKALAKRFKKGIDEEGSAEETMETPKENKSVKSICTTIENCARCGKTHNSITFKPFTNKSDEFKYSYWASCPSNGEPIMMRMQDGEEESEKSPKTEAQIDEADVSSQPNERSSNAGAQYKVVNGDNRAVQTGKLNRARQIQTDPEVNETAYKVQGTSYKTEKDNPQHPNAVNNPKNR
jgi:hypothetical protein